MNTEAARAVQAERDRVTGIINSPEARGNEERARTLAVSTTMTVDQARQTLAAESATLWDAALTGRGMKIDTAAAPSDASGLWDAALATSGMARA